MQSPKNETFSSQSKNAAAGFGTRWIAYIIDCLLIGFVSGIIGFPIMLGSLFSEESIWTTRVLFDFTLYAVVMYCIRAIYLVICTYSFGKTPGKALLRIEVQSQDGEKLTFVNVLFRETIGRFLNGILYVGYLIALSGKEHLALHDMLCDTRVCYSNLTEMEKKTPANVQAAQPIPQIVVGTGAAVGGQNSENVGSASFGQNSENAGSASGEQKDVNAESVNNSTDQVWTLPKQEEATVSAEQEQPKEPVQLEEVVIPEQEEVAMSEQMDASVAQEQEETLSEN